MTRVMAKTNLTSRQRFPPNKYPLSDDPYDFMDNHPDFVSSLKLSNTDRFELIPRVIISRLPEGRPRSNQVLGLFYLDKVNLMRRNPPYFKQDFVVNVEGKGREFISYTGKQAISQYVQPLNAVVTPSGS